MRLHLLGVTAFTQALAAYGPAPDPTKTKPLILRMTLRGNRFDREHVHVPSGTRLLICVTNADLTPAAFTSGALGVERLIAPQSCVMIGVGPLSPGHHAFADAFHPRDARGILTVTETLPL